jgi:hypothetical protein
MKTVTITNKFKKKYSYKQEKIYDKIVDVCFMSGSTENETLRAYS